MDTVVLKFGGSSVADNIKLNIVASKIIEFYNKKNNVVVVVSAQGKTTDKLLKEAYELTPIPNDRELDVLLSTGEQVTISKLSILLKSLGYNSISLTGWQAGILTNCQNQNASIKNIDISRIQNELEKRNIVIIAGFQGVNEKSDITTLGRGGSDTTAVAISAALNAKNCYIFSDVDGVYSTDPNKVKNVKKLGTISYEEMLEISSEGAKVLHNRSIEIAQKFNIPIITKSTFTNVEGTTVYKKIEDTNVKSIVKNDDIILINLKYENNTNGLFNKLLNNLLISQIIPIKYYNNSINNFDVKFLIKSTDLNKFQKLLETDLKFFNTTFSNISKISVVGHGIINDDSILVKIFKILELNNLEPLEIEIYESKIALTFKEKLSDNILKQFHKELILF